MKHLYTYIQHMYTYVYSRITHNICFLQPVNFDDLQGRDGPHTHTHSLDWGPAYQQTPKFNYTCTAPTVEVQDRTNKVGKKIFPQDLVYQLKLEMTIIIGERTVQACIAMLCPAA